MPSGRAEGLAAHRDGEGAGKQPSERQPFGISGLGEDGGGHGARPDLLQPDSAAVLC